MEACGDCKTLKQEFWRAREHYVSLIVQHDQMIRDSGSKTSTLDTAIKKARRRRNDAGRRFLDHRISHEVLISPHDNNSRAALKNT